MDRYKLKFTTLQNEIFGLMCARAGEKLSKRQIAKLLDVSPTAVAKALSLLEKEKLVKADKIKNMNLTYIELDRDNARAIELKRVENLRNIYLSGLSEYLEESFPGCTIILFGSFSKGEDTIKSDIDIAIIGTKGKDINLDAYKKRFEKEIRINF